MKKKKGKVLSTAIIVIAAVVFCVSAVQLARIILNYHESNEEYSTLSDDYTKPSPESGEPETPKTSSTENVTCNPAGTTSAASAGATWNLDANGNLIEDATPPISVDWASLQKINPDIIGWIYIEGEKKISYPVLHAEDNEYYLHRTFRKEHRYAGSIFMDYHNEKNWADPNTIVYGHNMRNGSMFGRLKFLDNEQKYREHPFFWILTPKGNYRYHIFAIYHAKVNSEAYTLFSENGSEFLDWEKTMQSHSEIQNNVPLSEKDKTVMLSTCTSDKSKRCVVIGKCVSTARP